MDWIAILDFGSQYTHLIARRVRELGVYSEILPYNIKFEKLARRIPRAVILSGGPAGVTERKSPACDKRIFSAPFPVLGICYGAQLMAKMLGGKVIKAKKREYGRAELTVKNRMGLFKGLSIKEVVWMSHGDRVIRLPKGFSARAETPNCPFAAAADRKRRLYGVQFHPEVVHTPAGRQILKNFIFGISGCKKEWNMRSFMQKTKEDIKKRVGNEKVICALSGGVDSSVMTVLLSRIIGKRLIAVFVDNGLLRKNEREMVKKQFSMYPMRLRVIDAGCEFLNALKGTVGPERKRKIIGERFIRIFEREAQRAGKIRFLAQGTLYPDVIESISPSGGPSATIKTHHNVGGLPKDMDLELIEPFRGLFKDEVRLVGKELGLPDNIVYRHPFPGPGLAVRILGEITKERLSMLREADWILTDEIKKHRLYKKLWQSFCVLLPVKTVGVMGDSRTYENAAAVRAVTSTDAMTANWARIPYNTLETISNRIINEVKGINRVVYDISSKPPATIEWE